MTAPRLLVAAALFIGCSRPTRPLPVFHTVGEFTLTAHTGAEFHSDGMLKGKVWVADFIFTNCQGPCPRMSTQMSRVQAALSDVPDIRFVSFTVDPVNDTPEVLAAYAKRYAATPDRWFFLTGTEQALHKLKREAFLLGNVDGSLNHSTRFVLVDRAGRIRKFADTSEASSIPELIEDARALVREPLT